MLTVIVLSYLSDRGTVVLCAAADSSIDHQYVGQHMYIECFNKIPRCQDKLLDGWKVGWVSIPGGRDKTTNFEALLQSSRF